ncbi:MAG: M15 family metallopeptidase [Bacteroidota bacterium]
MQRRDFVKKGLGTAAALSLPLNLEFPVQDDYSILELMGKEDIELFGGKHINLLEEAANAFKEMKAAAYGDGYDIQIASGYRSFQRQQAIWERKFIRYTEDDGMQPLDAIDKIIEYSTIPGTSRHHWGTEIDVIDGNAKVEGSLLVTKKYEEGGPFAGLKSWMDEHCEQFGFYLTYTNEPKRRGFKYEPWHYSYAPISIPMLAAFRKKNILRILQDETFLGSEYFTAGFLRSYIRENILDINPDLL